MERRDPRIAQFSRLQHWDRDVRHVIQAQISCDNFSICLGFFESFKPSAYDLGSRPARPDI